MVTKHAGLFWLELLLQLPLPLLVLRLRTPPRLPEGPIIHYSFYQLQLLQIMLQKKV